MLKFSKLPTEPHMLLEEALLYPEWVGSYFSPLFNFGVILDPQFPVCDNFKNQGFDIRLNIKY